jgi:predicted MPP superfamily phosphohydrolase
LSMVRSNKRTAAWLRRMQLDLLHRLSVPLYRLLSRLPAWEYGLEAHTVTRVHCRYTPLAGRRAVQISDLHVDRYLPRHDAILAKISDLKPDWIFVTGDLLNLPDGIPSLWRFLARLRQIAPVYMTLGNHDHASGVPVGRFVDLAERHKIHLLINQALFVPMTSGELAIIGLDDPSTHRADVRCIPPRVAGRFTVLLAHAPKVLDLLEPGHGVDLVLCGHSHGGQWRFRSVRPFWLPYGCRGLVEGHNVRNGHWMYVNRGLGWSLLPIRWNCPPEIVLIEWVPEEAITPEQMEPWQASGIFCSRFQESSPGELHDSPDFALQRRVPPWSNGIVYEAPPLPALKRKPQS